MLTGMLKGATSGGSASVVASSILAVGIGSGLVCSAWICRQTSFADSPIPLSVTSSRAVAVSMSSSSSRDCDPSRQNLPSMASETSSFLPMSRRHADCIVSS